MIFLCCRWSADQQRRTAEAVAGVPGVPEKVGAAED